MAIFLPSFQFHKQMGVPIPLIGATKLNCPPLPLFLEQFIPRPVLDLGV